MGFMRATFYLKKAAGASLSCLEHMLTVVGRSCDLRGIVRQLDFEGDEFFVVLEGWDYHVDRYIAFVEISHAALGSIRRVRRIALSLGDMRLRDKFSFVRAKKSDSEPLVHRKPDPGESEGEKRPRHVHGIEWMRI